MVDYLDYLNYVMIFDDARLEEGTYPPYDVYATKDKLFIKYSLAGYHKEDISLNFDPETSELKLEGIYHDKYDEVEIVHHNIFNKSFRLKHIIPIVYDINENKAEFKNGILLIEFKKKEANKPKSINIE